MIIQDAINLVGHTGGSLTVGVAPATVLLARGAYDIWSDVEVSLKVAKDASDVSAETGYRLLPQTVITVTIPGSYEVGIIAEEPGSFYYHRID